MKARLILDGKRGALGGTERVAGYQAAALERRGWEVEWVNTERLPRVPTCRRYPALNLALASLTLSRAVRKLPRVALSLSHGCYGAFTPGPRLHLYHGTFAGLEAACREGLPLPDRMVMRGVNGMLETACGHGAIRTAVSHQAQDEVRRYYGLACARVVHNGVELDHFCRKVDRTAARRHWNLPEGRFLVLVVGRMDYGKGRNILREMLPLLPPEAMAVIAAPSWSGLDTLPPEQYLHIPGVPYGELPALYQACDAHLSPSLYEGFGLTAIEAWASGIPVVSGRLGLLRELEGLEPSLDACLADVGDARGLAAAVEQLVRDPELGKRQAEWGSALVAERFAIERVTTEYHELIQQVLDRDKRESSSGIGSS